MISQDRPPGAALLGTLEVTLLNLRKHWPQGWPGLQLVWERCLAQLGYSLPPHDSRLRAIANCAVEVAQWLEREGKRLQEQGVEPPYHNRLHMADTLVSMTLLLKAQREVRGAVSTKARRHEWLGLLAMLAHDLLHDGSVNQYPGQLESQSARALQPLMQRYGMPEQDQMIVQHLILKTDPLCVRQAHAHVAERPFVIEDVDCLAVLVEEADILASTLAVTAVDLTRCLSIEWERSNPSMAPVLLTRLGRLRFLEFGALFSSPASRWMGIQLARQSEIEAINRGLADRSEAVFEKAT